MTARRRPAAAQRTLACSLALLAAPVVAPAATAETLSYVCEVSAVKSPRHYPLRIEVTDAAVTVTRFDGVKNVIANSAEPHQTRFFRLTKQEIAWGSQTMLGIGSVFVETVVKRETGAYLATLGSSPLEAGPVEKGTCHPVK